MYKLLMGFDGVVDHSLSTSTMSVMLYLKNPAALILVTQQWVSLGTFPKHAVSLVMGKSAETT